jgi:hypothetical protein
MLGIAWTAPCGARRTIQELHTAVALKGGRCGCFATGIALEALLSVREGGHLATEASATHETAIWNRSGRRSDVGGHAIPGICYLQRLVQTLANGHDYRGVSNIKEQLVSGIRYRCSREPSPVR